MLSYTPTIGLEIHAELKTRTKMFCNSPNNPDEQRPNVNICPVCFGHPGTLPVINREAVRHILKMGVAVGGAIADYAEFDRKNYFYPDLPKGYQISQFQYPLVRGGTLSSVAITRIHLEEDTARSLHDAEGHSLVDFNRAGIPLMELVTEPVIESAEQAGRFARELQLLLRYLGAGEANMEKGEMRVEANVSVAPATGAADERGSAPMGTKVEVKNLNSFRSVERAIAYEIERQSALLERRERVLQETRGWDEDTEKTFSQRAKEELHDYRYFPDPDLPALRLSELPEFSLETLRADMPDLPWEVRERLRAAFEVPEDTVEIFVRNALYRNYLDRVAAELGTDAKLTRLALNYIASDLSGYYAERGVPDSIDIPPAHFAELIKMVAGGEVSSRGAKDLLRILLEEGDGDPRALASERGIFQMSDAAQLADVVQAVIEEHPEAVSQYKGGKENSLQYLVGQGMKRTKGSANPELLQQLFREKLG